MAQDDYAVLVGNSRYPALSDLDGPVNDALSFRDWLLCLGAVPPENIELVVTPDNDETLNRKNTRPLRDLKSGRRAFGRRTAVHERRAGRVFSFAVCALAMNPTVSCNVRGKAMAK